MKKALISVSDKTNLIPFIKSLIDLGYEIISTGGTQKAIAQANLPVINISEITRFPEMLDGRVKTLHPNVHGGLLAIRDQKEHMDALRAHQIDLIDLVVVNLYPFKETVSKPVSYAEAIEQIDIGGPSMLRSAAKNHKFVTVVCDHLDYNQILDEIKTNGDTTYETRVLLAAKVFRHTAQYDTYIASYLTQEAYPEKLTITYDLLQSLRYGENPHQSAAFYQGEKQSYSLAHATQIQGKELSYNNIQDGNAALQITKEFDKSVVVAVKHMNPCGVGIGNDINEAWQKAYDADKVSIFGGIVSTNQEVNAEVAAEMAKLFLEIIIAPSYTKEALKVFAKKKNLRILKVDMTASSKSAKQFVSVAGGFLVQDQDTIFASSNDLKVVTKTIPTEKQLEDLLFAMKVCKHVKSNAIVVAKDQMTIGIGAGQMNRIQSAEIALNWAKKEGHEKGIILASDAFFPFDDVVKLAHQYGVTAIIQPGGSMRDQESIDACNQLGIAMVFSGYRHFKH